MSRQKKATGSGNKESIRGDTHDEKVRESRNKREREVKELVWRYVRKIRTTRKNGKLR